MNELRLLTFGQLVKVDIKAQHQGAADEAERRADGGHGEQDAWKQPNEVQDVQFLWLKSNQMLHLGGNHSYSASHKNYTLYTFLSQLLTLNHFLTFP